MADILKVSLLGTLPGGEKWSVNPVYRIGPPGDVIASAEGTSIVTAINAITIPTALRAFQGTTTLHTGVRLEARFLDGSLEGVFEGNRVTPVPGTGTFPHPFQIAAVSSLRSLTAGSSGRGRLYWPATGVNIDATTLRATATNVGTFLTGVRTYLTAIDAAIEGVLGPVNANLCVWSRLKGTTYQVNRIQMGDVMDVQRRRRDTAVEAYTDLSYPT